MWQAIVRMVEKWSCGHDWEIIYSKDYEDKESTSKWSDNGRSAHTRMVLKCKKCGKLVTMSI
jgi:hypothetical protein